MRPLLLLLGLISSLPALGEMEPKEVPKLEDDGGKPRVYFAHSYDPEHWDMSGLGDMVSLHVQNFDSLLKETGTTCTAIVLFIDGMPIRGLPPSSCDVASGHVRYHLRRTAQSDDTWHDLLGSPSGYTRVVTLSVGATEQFSVQTTVNGFQLEIVPRAKLFLFFGFLLVFGPGFAWLCKRRGLIRTGPSSVPVLKRPYNLSLFQMAFWFFLVAVAYIFIYMISGELDTITDSVLALLGIGAGTALGASLIDKNKQPSSVQEGAAVPPEAGKPLETQGFLNDLMNEDNGSLSLHRFQLFVWTLLLGVIFCGSVYRGLAMPDFSATLLGLMGISSGTFLGFKVPEGKKDSPEPGPAQKPEVDQ